MKTKSFIGFLLACTTSFAQVNFIPSTCHNRWGYTDQNGNIKIDYRFIEASRFSDGLAAVRINGHFGYIDTNGVFKINERFVEAGDFSEGLATVNLEGKMVVIDKTGKIPFDCSAFKTIGPFSHGKAQVITVSGAVNMIDKKGKLLLVSSYGEIGEFKHGLSIVKSFETNDTATQTYGVIDTACRVIVPLGMYENIQPFENGYAVVRILGKTRNNVMGMADASGIINTKGRLLFSIPAQTHNWVNGVFYEGKARVTLFRKNEGRTGNSSEDYYEGYIDTTGKIVFDHPAIKQVWDYGCGHAFVGSWKDDWKIIDRHGKFVSDKTFTVLDNKFVNNLAVVRVDDPRLKWGVIDTNGNFVAKPVFDDVGREGYRHGLLIVKDDKTNKWGAINTKGEIAIKLQYDGIRPLWKMPAFLIGIRNEKSPEKMLWGLIDSTGQIRVAPKYTTAHDNGDRIYVEDGNGYNHITPEGKIFPKPKAACNEAEEHDTLNISYKYPLSFDALSSSELVEPRNGNAQGKTRPLRMMPSDSFPANQMNLQVRENEFALTWLNKAGMQAYLFNTTNLAMGVPAIDGSVFVMLEAKNEAGEWKEISYIVHSDCGNSYHYVLLGNNQYWKFTTPVFKGEFKTVLRLKLNVAVNNDWNTEWRWPKKAGQVLYSNEFEGSVNPGQFADSK